MHTVLWTYLGWRRFPRGLTSVEARRSFSFSAKDRRELRVRYTRRLRLGAARVFARCALESRGKPQSRLRAAVHLSLRRRHRRWLIGVIDIDDGLPLVITLLLPHHDELSGRLRHLALVVLHGCRISTPLIGEVRILEKPGPVCVMGRPVVKDGFIGECICAGASWPAGRMTAGRMMLHGDPQRLGSDCPSPHIHHFQDHGRQDQLHRQLHFPAGCHDDVRTRHERVVDHR
jgi:hypothetical protein